MARQKLTKTKKDSIYSYIDTDKKKKYAYRYKFYDEANKRKEKSKQGFETIQDAEKALITLKATILSGNEHVVINENVTLNQWFQKWMQLKSNSWKPTTLRSKELLCRRHLLPQIGDAKLNKITKLVVQNKIIDAMVVKDFSKNTISAVCATLGSILNDAVAEEILDRRRYTKLDFSQTKPTLKKQALTAAKLEEILVTTKATENATRYAILLTLATTGMRKGELAALTWKDIDFESNTIAITKTRDEYGVRDPKTRNSIRTINMSSELAEHLASFKSWCAESKKVYGNEFKDDDYVFITANLEPISSSYIVKMFNALKNKHQIERFSAHILRHTFVSILIAEGVAVTTVAKIIGDTPEMVMKAYAHSLDDEELRATKILSSLIKLK
ncbi:tyrosine-type recombinase/integrase [Lysinibacillus xylanilyticus]|uniref:tyrosine-type recombinase/integrase n=1 Tax=Lysinibacillus xylanilyticus TaxID=582475 RepID=UPI00382C6A70